MVFWETKLVIDQLENVELEDLVEGVMTRFV